MSGSNPDTLGAEFVPEGATSSMMIGDVELRGIHDYREQGGMNAPSNRVETGYEYSSRVNREAITARFRAVATRGDIAELQALRQAKDPVPVYVKTTRLGECKVNEVAINESGKTHDSYEVLVEIEEVRTGTAGTRTLKVAASTGTKTPGAGSGTSHAPPTMGAEGSGGPKKEKKGWWERASAWVGRVL